MIEVNCLGLLYCTHYALPLIRDGGGGDVVNVSSVAGRTAALGSGVYNMTKWGVVGYSESLRQEGAHIGVRVTCVEPGYVETELQGHNKHPLVLETMEKIKEDTGKVLEADDIANAIVYAAGAAQARLGQRDPRAPIGREALDAAHDRALIRSSLVRQSSREASRCRERRIDARDSHRHDERAALGPRRGASTSDGRAGHATRTG